MTNFTKTYIGKGKQNPHYDIIKITLPIQEVLKHKYEKDGVEYITFELAKMKEADKYQRTHTAYIAVPDFAEKAKENTVAEPKSPELPLTYPNSNFNKRRNADKKVKV